MLEDTELHEVIGVMNAGKCRSKRLRLCDGKGRVITEESATRQVLDDLITQFDSSYNQQWNSFSDEYRNRMQRHIVAFEIIATRIETKFKLSQNRTKLEQENVIRALAENSDSAISRVAELMRQQGLGVERT